MAVAGESAHGFKAGRGLVELRWVSVRDRTGTHRDEFLYATDPSLTPAAIVGYYCGRWSIETTFQEMRAHLGMETTRGRCERTVTRAGPCLFGLYTAVALMYEAMPEPRRSGAVVWPGKATVTFSDALAAVRRRTWAEGVLPRAGCGAGLAERPE